MKNSFIKLSVTTLLSFNLFACDILTAIKPQQVINVSGNWENNIKNSDGSTVTTILEVKDLKKVTEQINPNYKDEYYTYSATLDSKFNGTQSETLKITTSKINISGTIRNNDLLITDVESENESITTNSKFTLSKDGNYLTLIPSEIKFKRKSK